MQGLESRKHKNMLKAIGQFEQLREGFGNIVPKIQSDMITEQIKEFNGCYAYYSKLFKELEDCIDNYKELQDSLQKTMFPYIKKMNAKAKTRKRYV